MVLFRSLVILWFAAISLASLWLPLYHGEGDGGEFFPFYAVIAGVAAVAVRQRAASARQALLSALPAIGILAMAAIGGLLTNREPDFGTEPIYLYFGVALWASWGVLMVATALASRTKWDGLGGVCLGFLVALAGLFLFTVGVN